MNALKKLENGLFNSISGTFTNNSIDSLVDNYLNSSEATSIINKLNSDYKLTGNSLNGAYSSILKSMLSIYVTTYYAADQSLGNMTAKVDNDIKNEVIISFNSNSAIIGVSDAMGSLLNASSNKDIIMDKLSNITDEITNMIAKQYNISKKKIASSVKLKYNEQQMARIFSVMMNQTESSYKAQTQGAGQVTHVCGWTP